jgi:hypothetical protein
MGWDGLKTSEMRWYQTVLWDMSSVQREYLPSPTSVPFFEVPFATTWNFPHRFPLDSSSSDCYWSSVVDFTLIPTYFPSPNIASIATAISNPFFPNPVIPF